MTWTHLFLQRQTLPFRPITLMILVVTCLLVFCLAAPWLHSAAIHIPSKDETKAVQAALMQFSSKYGHGPSGATIVKATKLDGTAWVVQITERPNPEPGGLRVVNTFYVGGSNLSCQWLSVEEWGAYWSSDLPLDKRSLNQDDPFSKGDAP
jgi:hypothetical protein